MISPNRDEVPLSETADPTPSANISPSAIAPAKSVMRRVLIVNTSFPPAVLGGAEHSIGELAHGLATRNHQVQVVCLTDGPTVREAQGRLSVIRLHSRAFRAFVQNLPGAKAGMRWSDLDKMVWHISEIARLPTYLRLRREIRRFKPDVVHLNNLNGFGWLSWCAIPRSTPSVQSVRDYSIVCTSAEGSHDNIECTRTIPRCRALKAPYTWRRIQPTAMVAVSDYVRDRMVRAGITGRTEPQTIYNSPHIDVDRVDGLRLRSGTPTIGYIGRIAPDKGVELLLDAMMSLWSRDLSAAPRLLIAGNGDPSYVSDLEERYREPIERDLVAFLGRLSPEELLAQVDLLAVPTQWAEPFGRVAAEALLARVPVVFSATGGLPEVHSAYGGSGIAVDDFRDSESWAVALQEALAGRWQWRESPGRQCDATEAYARLYERLVVRALRPPHAALRRRSRARS